MQTHKSFGTLVLTLAALALSCFTASRVSAQTLQVDIINQRGVEVFLSFGGTTTITGLVGAAPITLGTNYSVAANSTRSDIQLTDFNGRIFAALEDALTTPSVGNAFSPNFANPSLGDYGTRWDKWEINYATSAANPGINLTATDFYSVPLEIRTYTGSSTTPTEILTWTVGEAQIMDSLANLAINEQPSPDNAIVTGPMGVPTASHGNVVRTIAPSTTGGPNAAYNQIGQYVQAMRTAAQTTKIFGTANNLEYDLVAAFATVADPGTGAQIGDIVMTGTLKDISTMVTNPVTVVLPQTFLTSKEVFKANPTNYFVDGVPTAPSNSVFDAALRDVYVGFNIGAIGSTADNPNKPGTTFGNSSSQEWNTPNKLPATELYSFIQPNNLYYNTYAEAVELAGDAYGFPFTDFVDAPFASLDRGTITRLELVILPEPSTWAMAGTGIAFCAAWRFRRRRHKARA